MYSEKLAPNGSVFDVPKSELERFVSDLNKC
jgi:hypothetical protein